MRTRWVNWQGFMRFVHQSGGRATYSSSVPAAAAWRPGGLVAQAAGGGGDRGAMALQLALQMIDVLETLNQEIDQAAHSCGQV